MSNPPASWGSSVPQPLRTAKEILQDMVPDTRFATALDVSEANTLRMESEPAPINQIPPEILALIPDFFDPRDRYKDSIALTHVCRHWREVFISRASLWTRFNCNDKEKTRIYLERSKSSLIDVSLHRTSDISPDHPFFQVIPHATGRLKSLFVTASPESISGAASHMSGPAPFLERLSIDAGFEDVPGNYATLTPALFNGDLSSLRTLYLAAVRTELPWRNMVNLTHFAMHYMPPGAVSIVRLLDFLEGAPCLRGVSLRLASPPAGIRDGRLVSLPCLKSMHIYSDTPSSVLLDHLLIPVGAALETEAGLVSSLIGEHLPKSLDNLKNLSNFTAVDLYFDESFPSVDFSGPNGTVAITPTYLRDDQVDLILESLVKLDTSKVNRLAIHYENPPSAGLLRRALLSMTDLRTLTLSECPNPYTVVRALQPGVGPSEVVVCPKLEELVLLLGAEGTFEIASVVEMAAARASRGKKLRIINVVDEVEGADVDVSELRKHVWNVEYGPRVGDR